ncbi:XdhC family protein [Ferrimonas balearica]|uniref:XdhC family protein n=1 Tax=Ferrimonas balearica TaxID=44012 RepID=UPI001C96A381|nr:XdhC/CoxI family protein [Ferrimonas balearica]MBY5981803.1 XdhC family protein [Ferrimonas balearica]
MPHHPFHLLQQWFPHRDARQWVLGNVCHTAGSAYRKAGALMLFSDLGEQLGLLSGGCLESDLQRQAMAVMQSGRGRQQTYDSDDEDSVVYQLGIGCGGTVQVMLQPLSADNDYLQLGALYEALRQRQSVVHGLTLPDDAEPQATLWPAPDSPGNAGFGVSQRGFIEERGNRSWLLTPHRAPPLLAILGAGVDAQPLAELAIKLGWQVVLNDPRTSHGRPAHFPAQCQLTKVMPEALPQQPWFRQIDAAIVMHHQQGLDADALAALAQQPPRYCALLGPRHRRQQVLSDAGLATFPGLAGPAGLALGGELPEGIALSILAECHAALHGADGHSLSGVL